MESLHRRLERSWQMQTVLRAFEARDRKLLEDNLWKVSFWSCASVVVMLCVALTQVNKAHNTQSKVTCSMLRWLTFLMLHYATSSCFFFVFIFFSFVCRSTLSVNCLMISGEFAHKTVPYYNTRWEGKRSDHNWLSIQIRFHYFSFGLHEHQSTDLILHSWAIIQYQITKGNLIETQRGRSWSLVPLMSNLSIFPTKEEILV